MAEASTPFQFRHGELEAWVVLDAAQSGDAATGFVGATPEELHRLFPEPLTVHTNVMCFDLHGRRVLVDAGWGEDAEMPVQGQVLQQLNMAGISPESIDVMVITHGHADHVTGVIREGQVAFPNARFVIPEGEWDYWTTPRNNQESTWRGAWVERTLRRLQDEIELLSPGVEIVPGVRLIALPGHTVAHSGLEVDTGNGLLLHLSDALLEPGVAVSHLDWYPVSTMMPRQAERTRREVVARAAQTDARVFVCHAPFPGLGHIEAIKNGFAWVPLNT